MCVLCSVCVHDPPPLPCPDPSIHESLVYLLNIITITDRPLPLPNCPEPSFVADGFSVASVEIARLPLPAQILLMNENLGTNGKVIITPCGGISSVIGFLNERSTAIVFEWYNFLKNQSDCLECEEWGSLQSFNFVSYPVTPKEYLVNQTTMADPNTKKNTKWWYNRNWGQYVIDYQRLRDTVSRYL